ncbi:protein of unknown function [Streptantibioticus cattleyicolor NRRL 8057 = DSM 46488]|nr:protein of unknown function [Streptantibioticus cattleyicolor NRRL 8057 = DSM 46488]
MKTTSDQPAPIARDLATGQPTHRYERSQPGDSHRRGAVPKPAATGPNRPCRLHTIPDDHPRSHGGLVREVISAGVAVRRDGTVL